MSIISTLDVTPDAAAAAAAVATASAAAAAAAASAAVAAAAVAMASSSALAHADSNGPIICNPALVTVASVALIIANACNNAT